MIDPDTLLGLLKDAILANAEVMAFVDSDEANVTTYMPESPSSVDQFQAVQNMQDPSLLIAWTEDRIGDRSNGIEHYFSVFLRPRGKVSSCWTALREGTVDDGANSAPMKRYQLTPMVHPCDLRGCFTRQFDVGTIYEYHEVPIRITERGVDR